MPASTPSAALARVVGVPGAVLLGLGSILGTGIFVSIGLAAQVAGSQVLLAVALAAVVATFNGLSSAQLAAAHPVSGGTYEYGYRYLSPALGFTAGWMFLAAKSASAASAALGLSGYLLTAVDHSDATLRVAIAAGAVIVLTFVVAGGMRRSNFANTVIVGFTLLALAVFVGTGSGQLASAPSSVSIVGEGEGTSALLHATALMFVAYTGYGRVATLGEEVRDPARNIPRAIVMTLVLTGAIYLAVTAVALGLAGADGLARATTSSAAPLAVIARQISVPGVAWFVAAAAITAMTGVLLNLLLGLSRVLLAMGRRGDVPRRFAQVDARLASPRFAVFAVGLLITALVLVGDVKTTWSFSAFTVLVYYAITHLAALRMPASERRFPRIIAVLGLISCLSLAFWVEPAIWATGLGVIALGLVWHFVARR